MSVKRGKPKHRTALDGLSLYTPPVLCDESSRRCINLAANESPCGPSPQAIEAYHQAASRVGRYPAPGGDELRLSLASHFGLQEYRLFCGNGSEQLIDQIVRAYAETGDEVIISEYGFLCCYHFARAAGATPVLARERDFRADVESLLAAVSDDTRILYLANPNNPTGTYLTSSELQTLRNELPDQVLLVIDSAYAEYAERLDDYDSGLELVNGFPDNTVMLRTFSKVYGLAGLRVGWGYGSVEVAKSANLVRGSFNVSAPAQEAAMAALADTAHRDMAIDHNSRWLPWLSAKFIEFGLGVTASAGNFLLLKFSDEVESTMVYDSLREGAILTMPVAAYGLPQCLRITVGLGEDNERLIESVRRTLNS